MWLFIAFLAVPLIEIAFFIQVGGAIGLWPTLGIVILTALLGTVLVRTQGAAAMSELRRSFNALEDPSEPLAHGAMILVSGALLLTPGFFTDAVGFALLVPSVRRGVFDYLRKRVHVARFEMGGRPSRPHPAEDVIETDYQDLDDPEDRTRPPSGWTRH